MTLEKKDLRSGVRYTHAEVQHLIENKFSHRPPASYKKSLSELTAQNREVFLHIRDRLQEVDSSCRCIAYGSRTSDEFREDSDYDVTVITNETAFAQMKQIRFEFKVDLRFMKLQGIPL